MSQISMTFDTVTKEFLLSVDGSPMENVESVHLYRDCYCYDAYEEAQDAEKFRVEICQTAKDKENGTRVYTNTCASESNPELTEETPSKPDVQSAIANYFGANDE